MLSVVLTSLTVLSQVSYTACDALSLFRQTCSEKNIQNFNDEVEDGRGASFETATDPFAIATIWNAEFTEEAVKELRSQSSSDQILVNESFAPCEPPNTRSPDMELLEQLDWIEPLHQTQDWNFRVPLAPLDIWAPNYC